MLDPSKPDQLVSQEETSVISDVGHSDSPAPDAQVPALVFTDKLFKQFMKAYLEAQTPAPI